MTFPVRSTQRADDSCLIAPTGTTSSSRSGSNTQARALSRTGCSLAARNPELSMHSFTSLRALRCYCTQYFLCLTTRGPMYTLKELFIL